jgi:hypothetical protein
MRGPEGRRRGKLRSLCEEAGADGSDLEKFLGQESWARGSEENRGDSDGQETAVSHANTLCFAAWRPSWATIYVAKSYRPTRCLKAILEISKLLAYSGVPSELHGFEPSIFRAMVANRQTSKQLQGTGSEVFISGSSKSSYIVGMRKYYL